MMPACGLAAIRSALPLALLLLAGCGRSEPTLIDGSSQETFERTTRAAKQDLPVADRLDFDRAIATVGGRRLARSDAEALARTTFDGMTAEQIVSDYRWRER